MPVSMKKNKHYFSHISRLWRLVLFSLLLVCVLSPLAACASDASTSSDQQNAPTPTPTVRKGPAPGTVLYKADWSHGISGWEGASGWNLQNGDLYSKGGNQDELTVPYVSTTTSYAVEVRFQIMQYKVKAGGSFSFTTKHSGQIDGYKALVSNLLAPGKYPGGLHPALQLYIDPPSNAVPNNQYPSDYEIQKGMHLYRLEVRENMVDLFVDGVKTYTASSASSPYLSTGPLHIQSHAIILRVTGVTFTAL